MRLIALLAGTTLLASTAATAQTAPAAGPAAASPAAFTVEGTDLGTLLDNADTKAVLMKHIPQMIANEQINAARPLTLKALQQYAGELLTNEKLAQIDADLAKIPAKK